MFDANEGFGALIPEGGGPTVAAHAPIWSLHRASAYRVVNEIMLRAGVTGAPASPRGLRHGFGANTLQSGVPITLVQRWTAHARLSTTAIYLEVSGPDERLFASR